MFVTQTREASVNSRVTWCCRTSSMYRGNDILYCIQCTVEQTSSEGRSCECIYAANRSHDHSKTVTFVHPWPCGVSHKFAHAKKAILRHRLLVDTLKSYVNIITVSILFTVPHLIVLYIRTITSACCMHTLVLTASRSVVVDTNIHSMSPIIVLWRLLTASTHGGGGDKCLLNVKTHQSYRCTLTFHCESWSYRHIAFCLVLAIPNSLNSRLQWSFIVHHTTFRQHT